MFEDAELTVATLERVGFGSRGSAVVLLMMLSCTDILKRGT